MTRSVIEDADEQRFELAIDGAEPAVLYYRTQGRRLVLAHTQVPSEVMGQGYASALAAGVVDILRKTHRTAIPACEFMARYLQRHPETRDVLGG